MKKAYDGPGSHEWQACKRKAGAYASERIAAIRAQLIANDQDLALGVYKCPHCKSWHLTKNPNRQFPDRIFRPQTPVVAEVFGLLHGTKSGLDRSASAG